MDLQPRVNVNRVFTRIAAQSSGGTGGDADDREEKDTPRLGLASRGVLIAWASHLLVDEALPERSRSKIAFTEETTV